MSQYNSISLPEIRAMAETGDNVEPSTPQLQLVASEFARHFSQLGYYEQTPVQISSKADPTVRLIGAPISVLKPYIAQERTLVGGGVYLIQDCIRTHNVYNLSETKLDPEYGSFFKGMCALSRYDRLGAVACNAVSYFTDYLGVSPEDIEANVSSSNADLVDVIRDIEIGNINIDSKKLSYYQHTYGMDGVRGYNLNLAIKNPHNDSFKDVGNIIAIENKTGPIAVEFAIGDTTTYGQLLGLNHILESYGINLEKYCSEPRFSRRLLDTVMTSTVLYAEGLRPAGTDNRARLLRSYMKGIFLYKQLSDVSYEGVQDIIKLVADKLSISEGLSVDEMIIWLQHYEQWLAEPITVSKEDAAIINALHVARKTN